MILYWVDSSRNHTVTYEEFYGKIGKAKVIKRYIKNADPLVVFEQLICALVNGVNVTLLDADFSESEINGIGLNISDLAQEISITPAQIHSFDDLLTSIQAKKKDWRLEIFTSGTTGLPKSIKHSFDSLTRGVKVDDRFSADIWGFSYNPTHFAGLQVLFQGLINKNTFIYLFDKVSAEIPDLLMQNNVSRLSCTPTFCRQFIPYIKQPLLTVKSITFGGEKLDVLITEKLKDQFPNAKIRNVYASTEVGSILVTDNEFFSIPSRLLDYVKINSKNELLIHKSLMGETSEILNSIKGEWYHSGDLVEVFDNNKFKFLSRKSTMVNIGGYKVNPHEVEDEIRTIAGVQEVVVTARKNSVLGNVLIAKVVTEDGQDKAILKPKILSYLQGRLQEWKIPRLIKFVERVEKTRTGKVNRL
jgi:acyl-coenzyme A synthetase/AMP-(fatty) acid ligase